MGKRSLDIITQTAGYVYRTTSGELEEVSSVLTFGGNSSELSIIFASISLRKFMKKNLVILFFVLVFVVSGSSQEICTKYTPIGGGFSICLPDGWTNEAMDEGKYRMIVGTTINGFRTNLNFKDEAYTGSLKAYTDAGVAGVLKNGAVKSGAAAVTLKSRSDFVTSNGQTGIKVVFDVEYQGIQIISTQYYFDLPGKKLIMTFTTLESEIQLNGPIFDAAVRSFRGECKDKP